MSNNIFADNHARGTVPENEYVSGVSIGVVLVGMMLTLPIFVLAGEVLAALGAAAGVAAVFIGGVILAVIASVTGYVGAKTRLSTYSIIIAPFGTLGARGLTALFAVVASGWFGVTVGFFGQALDVAFREIAGVEAPFWVYALGGGALMTGTVLFGFKGISLLNRYAVPLLALVLVWAGVKLLGEMSFADLLAVEARPNAAIPSFGLAVSAVVGSVIAAACGMADLARFARRRRDVYIAAFLSFASLSMGLSILSGAPSLMTGDADFTSNLIAVGLGAPAIATLILATWTTNIINLYAASLSLGRLVRVRDDWVLTAVAGAAGTIFALAGATGIFINLLLIISALIPPIAGVFATHYFLTGEAGEGARAERLRVSAFAAWAAGGGVALATTFTPLSLSTVSAIDALAVSAAVYFALSLAARKAAKAP